VRTLFCIIGNLRGGQAPYDSFKVNFSDKADLALCVGNTHNDTPWEQNAKYICKVDESNPHIWEEIYDSVSTNWRNAEHVINLWGPYKNLPGSGMIICALRQKLYEFISNNNIKYDRYVLTRADHIYTSSYLPEVKQNTVYIPQGEEYGGVTDRYLVADHETFLKSLQIIEYIQNNLNKFGNVEQYLLSYFISCKFDIRVIKRTMYTVQRSNEQTRWHTGSCMPVELPFLNPSNYEQYFSKYASEYDLAISNKEQKL